MVLLHYNTLKLSARQFLFSIFSYIFKQILFFVDICTKTFVHFAVLNVNIL